MKILFGIPDVTHRELAELEIKGIETLLPNCEKIHYGPVQSKRGMINKIVLTYINARSIKTALKKSSYDLLFLNTTFDFNGVLRDSFTYLILRPKKTKIFLKFHGQDPSLIHRMGYQSRISRWLLSKVHGVGVFSKEEKTTIIKMGCAEEKVFIVKNPVNPKLYIKDVNFKKKMVIEDGTFVFIFSGRFLPFKGIVYVIKALSIVVKTYPKVHLFCLGDGPQMSEIKEYIEQNKLNKHITLTGFIPEKDTYYYYANADALVFPSSHEGFPMAVFQSLAAGIAIITTQIAASNDYLKEPENVLWINPVNHESIANLMMRLISDKELTAKMKKNNKKLAKQFTSEKNAIEYLHLFEELTKK